MIDAVFFYELDCPICNVVLTEVIEPIESKLSFEFKRVEVNGNRGGDYVDWYRWFTTRIGRRVVPLVRIGERETAGLDSDRETFYVPRLPDLPVEERIVHAGRLMREVGVMREKIVEKIEQLSAPKTGPPLGLTHRAFKTGYIVPRRI